MHAFLRTHKTVTFERPRGLVSPGAAWRQQARFKAARKQAERERERWRAYFNDPDNPTLTAKGRAKLLARLNPQPQERADACPPD